MTEKKNKEIKPLEKKVFSLENYKAKNKLNDNVRDKPLEYIQVSPAFQKVTGLSIIKGVVNIIRGYSNTGKSTLLVETAIGCQKQGILPVIIDTENGWNWNHCKDMGFEFEEYVDEDSGEISYKGFFIYINNDYLINEFGKKRDKNRDEAVIEDVAMFMNKCLDDQTKGELKYELCFLFDSIGSLDCEQGVTSDSRSNMWAAAAYEQSFKSLANYRIPASRKVNKEYTNTLVAVNKVWLNSMNMGQPTLKSKGGEFFYFAARLIFLMGGIQSHGTKKLIAKANGKDYVWGTQTKVTVEKNHITGTSYKGDIISTAHGFILAEDADSYKKEHKEYILSKIGVSKDTQLDFFEEETNEIFETEE